jgi:hypothetical protein
MQFKIEVIISENKPKHIINSLQYYLDEYFSRCDADILHEIVAGYKADENIQRYTITGFCIEDEEYLQSRLKDFEDFFERFYKSAAVAELTILED